MQPLYLIDFDGTLFNSDKFHADIAGFLKNKLGVDLPVIKEAYNETKKEGKPHHLKKHLEVLEVSDIKQMQKEVRNHLISLKDSYLYSDTLQFLNQFKQPHLIYTFAMQDHYRLKMKVSRLRKHKLPVLMVDSDKSKYLAQNLVYYRDRLGLGISQMYTKIYWIDDKIDGFKNTIEGVEFVRIKREGSKYATEPTPKGITEITSLLELI